MRQSLILLGVCVLLLFGAWLGSRTLSEASAGAPASTAAIPAPPTSPTQKSLEVQARGDPGSTPAIPTGMPGGAPAEAAKPTAAPSEAAPDDEENPFIGESRELDYADRLRWEEDAGVERLTSAREVYKRCIESARLQRCKDGLAAVEARLYPPKAVQHDPVPAQIESAGFPKLQRIKQ